MTYTKGVVLMIMPIGTYVRQGQRILRRFTADPKLSRAARYVGFCMLGLMFSAASLGNAALPLPLCLLCAGICGWDGVMLALGSAGGYLLFWGNAGIEGIIWTGAGLLLCLSLGNQRLCKVMPLLLPALSAVTVAITGLMLLFWGRSVVSFPLFLLRVALALGASLVFTRVLERRDPVMDWLACALGVLALAQIAPLPQFSLGLVAAGALAAAAPFPAVALAGLSIDLSRITPAPITAVVCLAFFLRLVPHLPKWVPHIAPAAIYLVAAPLCGVWNFTPVLPLLLGGGLGLFLPPQAPISHRRGETGVAQVRLELAASVLAQSEQLLLEVQEHPIDEAALIVKAADRACITCPCRKNCTDREQAMELTPSILHRPLVGVEDVPLSCRKRGRLLTELRRVQEQLRAIKADRDRQREYRNALIQEYSFLSAYLQELADSLPRRAESVQQRFDPDISACTAGLELANGDKCMWFAGPGSQYYVLLCDGMGTGPGAEEESRSAANMLRRLLTAGYPAQHALRSLNSLCTLRNRAGAVTVDLAQIDLQTGKASVYKWGAAPSYVLSKSGAEKIGTAGPPPGLSVTNTRETVDKLSLRQGQTLILLSDGVDGEDVIRRGTDLANLPTGELAARVLQYGRGQDDATAAVIRLRHWPSST